MPNEQDMITAATVARERNPLVASLPLCSVLDLVYDTLMELKRRSPWHWQVVIRAIHGLISKARRAMRC